MGWVCCCGQIGDNLCPLCKVPFSELHHALCDRCDKPLRKVKPTAHRLILTIHPKDSLAPNSQALHSHSYVCCYHHIILSRSNRLVVLDDGDGGVGIGW
jgi:predicted amidophosphoribosyltransferase